MAGGKRRLVRAGPDGRLEWQTECYDFRTAVNFHSRVQKVSYMKSSGRLIAGIVSMLLPLAAGAAGAGEPYPNKPGRLILPFGADDSTDVVRRIFAQRFSEA